MTFPKLFLVILETFFTAGFDTTYVHELYIKNGYLRVP